MSPYAAVVECVRPIFKTEISIQHSKANFDGEILIGKTTHHFGWKMHA